MGIQFCSCCGRMALPPSEQWAVVDPDRPRPAEWLCPDCERAFEFGSDVIVFSDRRRHIATLLSDSGLRAARRDARNRSAA